MDRLYPPVGFHFKLHFSGLGGSDTRDAAFQEVSGLNANMEIKEVPEGGENRFVHRLPGRVKYSDLVLKRGYVPSGSSLGKWVTDTLSNGLNQLIEPQGLTLQLLDENASPLATWSFAKAYPTKWQLSDLNAGKSEIVVESITFVYDYFEKI